MNRNLKDKKSKAVITLFILLGWFIRICPAEASQMFFPFIADDSVSFEMNMPFTSLSGLYGINPGADKTEEESGTGADEENDSDKKKKETAAASLSKKEKQVLYKVVSMECDTGYEGSLAVISCMLNRTASKKYPDDLMDVVREDSQFTAYYDKSSGTYPYKDREPSKECIAAVEDALNKGKRNIPSYILYFRSADYDYLKGYERYGQIGDNTYFYLNEDVQ